MDVYGGQLISGPVALRRLVRLAPLHPHIMGNVICAWFGKKTVGRVVVRQLMMMKMISNTQQSKWCGGGRPKTMEYYYYY